MNNFISQPITAAKKSFFSIDILRGISAVGILIFHYFHFLNGSGAMDLPHSILYEIPSLNRLSWFRDHGSIAVMLFWTISGFVFMNVYAGLKPPFNVFFVNRLARLYPLHIVTLITVAVLQIVAMQKLGHYLVYETNDFYHFILHLFFASEWVSPDSHSLNGPIWSVSIEVIIYAAFYLYVRFFEVTLRTQLGVLVAFFIAMKVAPDSNIPVCGAYFFCGTISYTAYFFCPAKFRKELCIASIIATGAMTGLYVNFGTQIHLPITIWLLAIFAPLLLALALSEALGLQRWYKRGRAIGDITYSTYLWHSPLQMMFLLGAGLGAWPLALVRSDAFVAAYVIVTCLISWLSFRHFERPAQNFVRESLLGKRKPAALISAP